MSYLGELRINWRYVGAACVGLGSGFGLNQYVAGTFADHLIGEFGWSKSQFALTGLTIIISMIALPITGRLTDRFGVMRIAPIGVALTPLFYLAYAAMPGSFAIFFAINVVQTALVGATTTSTVYSRLIAERFLRARGMALSLAACSPAAAAAVIIPLLSGFIESHGWRAGYLMLAGGTAITGLIAMLLVPRGPRAAAEPTTASAKQPFHYREIFANRAYQIIVAGVLLANITHMVMAPQLKLMLLEHGLSGELAASMLSLFAVGIMIGRLGCGVALDRFPSHIVSAIALGLPAIGIFILLSGVQDMIVIGAAVLMIGMSTGAEFDVLGYLAMRFFRVEIYSTVYSSIAIMVSLSSAAGAGLLSLTLKLTDSYVPFLIGGAISTLVGAGLFLLLGRIAPAERAET
jgi:MFS family permease